MAKNRDYSLPNAAWLRIFQYSENDDLFNLQQVCYKFRTLIENEKRNEIKNDWRLKFTKHEKFNTEISTCSAIRSLEIAKVKNGNYSLRGTYIPKFNDIFETIAMNVFNEVRRKITVHQTLA